MPTFKRADQEQLEKAQDLLENAASEMGFIKSLYFGRLKLDDVMPYPQQDPDEKRRTDELIEKVEAFMKTVDADRIDREERIPQHVIDGLGKLGVFGLVVPKEYGGGGFSHTAYCRVLETVSRYCASTGVMVGAHQSIGLKALVLMGTEQQKKQFLPELASGRMLSAFCLSEPEVGSDAANVQTIAHLSEDGKHWVLTGEKKFATNAALAGMLTVMAKTPITDKSGKIKDKITAFIVTPDLPGFEIVSHNRTKMGVRGTWQGTLRFTNMPVPTDRILGELGKGLKVALSVLDFGRCTLSAGCVGGAKRALELSIDRARKRRQFGRPIGEFHLVKEKIARMAEMTYAMEAVTYMAAGLVDKHVEDIMLETAVAKLFCSEGLWQMADDTLQIWGGEGYMREHGIERMVRDARINRIVEGATEVMTAFVALVGMKGVGESFEQVLRAGKHPIDNFGRLRDFARSQWSDIVVGHTVEGLPKELKGEGEMLAKLTKKLARAVGRLLRKHQHGIIDLEMLHARVAWTVVELYAIAAVISKLTKMLADSSGNGHTAHNLLIGKTYCLHASERIELRLSTLFHNSDEATLKVADEVLKLA